MKFILCNCGEYILVDNQDEEKCLGHKWTCSKGSNVYEHHGTGSQKFSIPISEHILGHREGFIIDHKDNNKHNNLRNNLRYATRSQNGANRRANKNNPCGYKGVGLNLGKWCAKIRKDGKDYWLGYHSTPEDAARAYNKKAKELFGEFALLNNI